MTKRKLIKKHHKRKTHKNKSTNFKLLNSLLAIIVALILVIAYILYSYDSQESKKQKTIEKRITEVDKTIEINKDKFEEYTKDLYEEYVDKDIIDTTKKKIKEIKKDVKDIIEEPKGKKQTDKKEIIVEKIIEHKTLATQTNKPKLAIVIDDVTTQYQVNKINSIGYKTTISLLPPTPNHPNSARIAQNLPFHMIHFPLEATTFRGEEKNTLHIHDSYEKIEKRVSQIRKWYPNTKYTNNHTGSRFTENEPAMNKLFQALKKYDFTFMDSRTTGKTVGKEMAKKYNMPYIARNVFLDNEQDFAYIQNQLKKAIKIAKRKGYAIAICHPHSITIKVLKKSKHLLKDLELIYLNQLPLLNK